MIISRKMLFTFGLVFSLMGLQGLWAASDFLTRMQGGDGGPAAVDQLILQTATPEDFFDNQVQKHLLELDPEHFYFCDEGVKLAWMVAIRGAFPDPKEPEEEQWEALIKKLAADSKDPSRENPAGIAWLQVCLTACQTDFANVIDEIEGIPDLSPEATARLLNQKLADGDFFAMRTARIEDFEILNTDLCLIIAPTTLMYINNFPRKLMLNAFNDPIDSLSIQFKSVLPAWKKALEAVDAEGDVDTYVKKQRAALPTLAPTENALNLAKHFNREPMDLTKLASEMTLADFATLAYAIKQVANNDVAKSQELWKQCRTAFSSGGLPFTLTLLNDLYFAFDDYISPLRKSLEDTSFLPDSQHAARTRPLTRPEPTPFFFQDLQSCARVALITGLKDAAESSENTVNNLASEINNLKAKAQSLTDTPSLNPITEKANRAASNIKKFSAGIEINFAKAQKGTPAGSGSGASAVAAPSTSTVAEIEALQGLILKKITKKGKDSWVLTDIGVDSDGNSTALDGQSISSDVVAGLYYQSLQKTAATSGKSAPDATAVLALATIKALTQISTQMQAGASAAVSGSAGSARVGNPTASATVAKKALKELKTLQAANPDARAINSFANSRASSVFEGYAQTAKNAMNSLEQYLTGYVDLSLKAAVADAVTLDTSIHQLLDTANEKQKNAIKERDRLKKLIEKDFNQFLTTLAKQEVAGAGRATATTTTLETVQTRLRTITGFLDDIVSYITSATESDISITSEVNKVANAKASIEQQNAQAQAIKVTAANMLNQINTILLAKSDKQEQTLKDLVKDCLDRATAASKICREAGGTITTALMPKFNDTFTKIGTDLCTTEYDVLVSQASDGSALASYGQVGNVYRVLLLTNNLKKRADKAFNEELLPLIQSLKDAFKSRQEATQDLNRATVAAGTFIKKFKGVVPPDVTAMMTSMTALQDSSHKADKAGRTAFHSNRFESRNIKSTTKKRQDGTEVNTIGINEILDNDVKSVKQGIKKIKQLGESLETQLGSSLTSINRNTSIGGTAAKIEADLTMGLQRLVNDIDTTLKSAQTAVNECRPLVDKMLAKAAEIRKAATYSEAFTLLEEINDIFSNAFWPRIRLDDTTVADSVGEMHEQITKSAQTEATPSSSWYLDAEEEFQNKMVTELATWKAELGRYGTDNPAVFEAAAEAIAKVTILLTTHRKDYDSVIAAEAKINTIALAAKDVIDKLNNNINNPTRLEDVLTALLLSGPKDLNAALTAAVGEVQAKVDASDDLVTAAQTALDALETPGTGSVAVALKAAGEIATAKANAATAAIASAAQIILDGATSALQEITGLLDPATGVAAKAKKSIETSVQELKDSVAFAGKKSTTYTQMRDNIKAELVGKDDPDATGTAIDAARADDMLAAYPDIATNLQALKDFINPAAKLDDNNAKITATKTAFDPLYQQLEDARTAALADWTAVRDAFNKLDAVEKAAEAAKQAAEKAKQEEMAKKAAEKRAKEAAELQKQLAARKSRRVYTATTSKFAAPAASSSATDFAIAGAQAEAAEAASNMITTGINKATLKALFDANNILALQEALSRLIASGKGAELKKALEDKGGGSPALIDRVKSGGEDYLDIQDLLRSIGYRF